MPKYIVRRTVARWVIENVLVEGDSLEDVKRQVKEGDGVDFEHDTIRELVEDIDPVYDYDEVK